MTSLLCELQDHVQILTFNRVDKQNAFDEHLLGELQTALDVFIADPIARVLLLKANGRHFSAGADLTWMQRMAQFNEAANVQDANVLARVMRTLYECPKPTIAMIQGAAFGGGAGLVAACDIGIAAHSARFCFSEVTLGLIPAVISPYVIKAIGERAATHLFMTAEPFGAQRAYELQLIQLCVADETLFNTSLTYAHNLSHMPPHAVRAAKALVRQIAPLTINVSTQELTARLIAKTRASLEAQVGIQAFLNKKQS